MRGARAVAAAGVPCAPAPLVGHVVEIDEHRDVPVAVAHVLLVVARLAVVEVRLVPLARRVLDELQRLDVLVRVARHLGRRRRASARPLGAALLKPPSSFHAARAAHGEA